MSPVEPSFLLGAVGLLGGFAVNALFTAALVAWGRWVARRQGGGVGWRRLAWAPAAGFVLNCLGLLLTIAGLLHAFGGVADARPEDKARLLSDGIGTAMGATAVCGSLSALAYVVSIVMFVVGSVRAPRR